MGKTYKGIDMLNGSLWDKILKFAVPLALGSILQQLFNAADIAVVGRFAGADSLAAVGANSPVINLLVNLFVGLSIGANVIISNALGEQSARSASRGVHTAIVISLVSGLLLSAVGILFARPILQLVSTPENILSQAALYLRLYFCGMPFVMLYNFSAAVLRSKGDTQRPFYVLLVAGVVNLILNILFVVGLGMDVDGVAIATVISNGVSSITLLYFLRHEVGPLKLEFWKLRVTPLIFRRMMRVGLPAGLQGVVFSLSNVCIQSAINSLGSSTIAASAAALNLEYFVFFWLCSFSQACTTFVGQNKGAGNLVRCRRVLRWCLFLDCLTTSLLGVICLIFAHPLLSIFTTNEEIIRIATIRVVWVLSLEGINVFLDVVSGALRGLGHSLKPALICMVGVCGVRIAWVYTVFAANPSFKTLMYVYPVSWIVTSVVVIGVYFAVIRNMERSALR